MTSVGELKVTFKGHLRLYGMADITTYLAGFDRLEIEIFVSSVLTDFCNNDRYQQIISSMDQRLTTYGKALFKS